MRVQLNSNCKLGIVLHHFNMEVSIYIQVADVGRKNPTKRVLVKFSLTEGMKEIVSLFMYVRVTKVDSFHLVVLGSHVSLAASLVGSTVMGEIDNVVDSTLQSRVVGCLSNVISERVGIYTGSFDGVTPLAICVALDSMIVCGKFERGMCNCTTIITPQLELAPLFEIEFGFTDTMPSGDVMQD